MSTHTSGRALAVVLAFSLAVFVAGCGGSATTNESATESIATGTTSAPTVEQARKAGTIAGAIEKEPNRATEILAEHGVSAESLESLILDIAKDSTLTEAYEEAKAAAAR